MKVGSIVIDCNDFAAMKAFWQAALRYEAREPAGDDDDFTILRDPAGEGVNVSIDTVPEPRSGKNRLHLDLYTDQPEAEIERLLGLGATRHPRTPEPGEDFTVLADPEGNLFCVVDTRVQ
jgi:catechol 2,3-dioxygenase-like lactoylglutathione lyase family enzyme